MEKVFYFKVAPKAPLLKYLTYKYHKQLKQGQRVKIPLGSRKVNGLILDRDFKAAQRIQNIKEILELDQNSPPLSPERICWLKWMSDYYRYPLGLVADLSFSQAEGFKKKKAKSSLLYQDEDFIKEDKTEKINLFSPSLKIKTTILKLTVEQKDCVDKILKSKGFNVHLIHGVTGSGKTEIYKKLMAHALNQKLQVLILLPEIFLTPQIVKRFSESFPGEIALLHSQITAKQKRLVWQSLLTGGKNLLVGTRSALFCPLPRLGLIIVDEEHDSSFKQEDKFRYHARDSAIVLAKKLSIPVVLGSATPDFSSYQKALDGSYQFYELKKRAFQQELPQITVLDLKQETQKERPFWLSDLLMEKMRDTLQKGKQVALFLNRRGQATSLICSQCGHTKKCPNCDISLTLHGENHLLCHYCSYLEQKLTHCPSCKSSNWLEKGFGTQAVQKVIEKYFPDFKILRADRDSINSREEMENFVNIVEKKQTHIIIGTQMISKGLNFPSIHLVGLILADMDFHLPDFRAGERAFQTLLQMAGRAGRTAPGEVVLQTFNPEHPTIFFSKRHDYKNFFYEEIKSRKRLFYPPFSRLCLLRIDCLKEKQGWAFAKKTGKKAMDLATQGIKVLGPSSAPLMKIKNRYRFQILIKSKNHQLLNIFLKKLLVENKKKSFAQIKVDRDPFSML